MNWLKLKQDLTSRSIFLWKVSRPCISAAFLFMSCSDAADFSWPAFSGFTFHFSSCVVFDASQVKVIWAKSCATAPGHLLTLREQLPCKEGSWVGWVGSFYNPTHHPVNSKPFKMFSLTSHCHHSELLLFIGFTELKIYKDRTNEEEWRLNKQNS